MKQKQILIWGVALESLLAAIYFFWAYLKKHTDDFAFSFLNISSGVLVAGVLFVLNFLLVKYLKKNSFGKMYEFMQKIVHPLAMELDVFGAFVVSLAAGFGEELFFRGLLQNEFGILVSSLAFAVLHFGTACLVYPLVVSIYFFVSLVFAFHYEYSGSLIQVVIAHAVYDFFALLFLKKQAFLNRSDSEATLNI